MARYYDYNSGREIVPTAESKYVNNEVWVKVSDEDGEYWTLDYDIEETDTTDDEWYSPFYVKLEDNDNG